ncbi:MAG TPA: cyclic nucleotide-binding domain-containing protein [Verrucomicrobiaceae bacterium]|jgi:CRP-like cAMP-binding protein
MIPPEERQKFLLSIPLFAGMEPEALAELAAEMTERSYPASGLVFREGDPGGEMFIIHSGRVEIIKHLGESREITLAKMQTRECFGEMAVVDCVARSASVQAMKGTVLFCVKAAHLHHLFQHRPAQYAVLILNISRDLSRRLRALDENWAEVSRHGSLDEAMIRAMEA